MSSPTTWPPALSELKVEVDVDVDDTTDDVRLTLYLDAAVWFVQRIHAEAFDFVADPLSELPAPDPDLRLGTLRLAARWNTRRRSPDGLVAMAELGAARVSSSDPDIDRMLRIGRFAGLGFA